MSGHDHDLLSIAIVGMAGRFPAAGDPEALWRLVRDGAEAIRRFTPDELEGSALRGRPEDPGFVPAAGAIDGIELFDAGLFELSPREAELTDPQHRLFLECVWEALERAGCDPGRFRGAIGVFAGSGLNQYFLNNVLAHPEVLATVPQLQVMIGADKDYLAPLVAYKLDLRGPAVSVQSACSTSLVAVHLACQSLIDQHCDLALAGGVSVRVPQRTGYRWQEGGIYSPDGHCRAFDARAQGTVIGSGAGVVVLKRLAEALEDGDPIHAVIRGSAINNDGAAKVGFTAPGLDGQVRVISEALAAAGVAGREISYVEAHGTGTRVGDPIEVAALNRAFEVVDRPASCALGSLKSNLGHLDTAAGVAGLIKTALALAHRTLPPTVGYEHPNPEIDFAAGPFRVLTAAEPWPRGEHPRRAGVSSFGIGGTNAHVVLEEAPAPPAASPPLRPWQLLVLSARSPAALETVTGRLAEHLRTAPEPELADVAWTLQTGRRRFAHRRALVCRDRAEALALLGGAVPERAPTLAEAGRGRPVAWMFSGQGAQYPGMGQGLYQSEPSFRRALDRCAELLRPHLPAELVPEQDLRRVLFPPADADPQTAGRLLAATAVAQPALFAVEWALAELWSEWLGAPAVMVGHSVGAWVAACRAGVFALADALRLVALRGRLMGEQPRGEMLSLALGESAVGALLDEVNGALAPAEAVALAAINAPELCVVSGAPAGIAALRRRLEAPDLAARGLEARALHTSHAFHSPMMDPVLDRFAAAVAAVERGAAQIPVVSDTTGGWLTPEQAGSARYWAEHLRRPVRFADALTTLCAEPSRLLLEVGPGRSLATLARRHPARAAGQAVVGSLRPPAESDDDPRFLLEALGRLWLAGAEIDWRAVAGAAPRRRVVLPTYPFERRRHWLEPRAPAPWVTTASPAHAESQTEPHAVSNVEPDAEPAPDRPALTTPWVAPRNPIEEGVAAIWRRALGIAGIGVLDDFFELGGHSLLATQIGAELRSSFRIEIALGELFTRPTVAAMAARVVELVAERGSADPAAETPEVVLPVIVTDPVRASEPFELTDVQQAYWIGRSAAFELGGVATHVYWEMDLGAVDLRRLERAFDVLIRRQHMLRAVVLEDGRQQILPEVPPFRIPVLDLRGVSGPAVARALAALRRKVSHQVLPAHRWPLFELRASRLPAAATHPATTRLHVSFDLLIGDAWSFQIIARELSRLYRDPAAALPPLGISFRDYVVAARGLEGTPAFARDLAYWRARLETLPAAPELPLARSPAELGRPVFVRLARRLAARRWERLKQRAAGAGLTPSGVLLAAFAEVLAAWSKSPRFTLNLTLFNRLPLHPDVNGLIGDFTSLTLLAIEHERGQSFLERARAIQDQLWRDLDHRLVSGVRVLRELARAHGGRGAGAMPVVFTSTLNMPAQAAPTDEEAAQVEERTTESYAISQTPQVWIDHQVEELRGALSYNWDVVENLFPAGMLRAMFETYAGLLERLAEDDGAWRARDLELLPAAQRALRAQVNATAEPVPEGLLHEPFLARAAERPDAVAVRTPELCLSYGELRRRAGALAQRLRRHGVRPDTLVAVVMAKGWEQVVAVLAITEAGAAYLPIDAGLPAERRRQLLASGRVELALVQAGVEVDGVERWVVGEMDAMDVMDGMDEEAEKDPERLAYVIFTSGSTGVPKGVMVSHRSALNTLVDVNQRFGVGSSDAVLGLSSLSFDLSVYDVFGVLGAGGTLVLPDPGLRREPAHWAELLAMGRVTLWNTVPALLEMLVGRAEAVGEPLPRGLRLALLSGDWIPLSLPARFLRLVPAPVEVVSLGGATEGAIWSIYHRVPPAGDGPGWPSVPYGRPLANQTFHVLRSDLSPRPDWVPGELAIGGLGVARGYWDDPEKTAQRFVTHPGTGERLYLTGDLGRYRPDGTLEFLGREDTQVKIRGYRIELGEVEAALASHPAVREAVVVAWSHDPRPAAPRRLVAHVVAEGATPEELRVFLAAKLPEHMVPAIFVPLAALPLTANGKVDRGALARTAPPTLEPRDAAIPARAARPMSALETTIATLCAEVLGVAELGLDDNFFELGGDSLSAMRTSFRLRQELGVEIAVRTLFEAPSVAGLARAVAGQAAGGDLDAPARREDAGPPPLSFAQERYWRWAQRHPERADHNLYHLLGLLGPLDRALLAAALGALVGRHEALHSRLAEIDGVPRALAEPEWRPALPIVDLQALPAAARRGAARFAALALARPPFDLAAAPPLRLALLALGATEHALVLVAHHAILDGASLEIVTRELGALLRRRSDMVPAPRLRQGDVAVWERQRLEAGALDADLAWWRRQLAGAPTAIAWPTVQPARGGFRRTVRLEPAAAQALRGLAQSEQTTLFSVVCAALAATVHAVAGGGEVVVGTPLAQRLRPETRDVVGLLLNLVPLRIDASGAPDLRTLVARTRDVARDSFARGEVPIERLVEELAPAAAAAGDVPWVRVLCTLLAEPAAGEAGMTGASGSELLVAPLLTGEMGSELDLTCHARELREPAGALRLDLGLSAACFDADSAQRLVTSLETLLRRAVAQKPAVGGARQRVVVVGAGLVGTFAAITLARRGCAVEVVERRADPRALALRPGRSINITLSTRGFTALDRVGVGDAVRAICVPLYGRVIHDSAGGLTTQPYGNRGEAIHSVSRGDLNRLLVEQAEQRWPIRFRFEHRCLEVEPQVPALRVRALATGAEERLEADAILAADGAFSTVRRQLQRSDRFNYSQHYVGQAYKELKLPPGAEGDWALDPNALHLWPRGRHMLIGFPNVDRSFTLALHLPFEGEPSLASVRTAAELEALFARDFPDVAERIPRLAESFFAVPPTSMVTIRCSPWTHGRALSLIGDAAHAIVPSYGQGANCGFEDCTVLDACLDAAGGDFAQALREHERLRKPDSEAIADLALAHFKELQESVADPRFLLRKQLERRLNDLHPERFMPLYSMVSFTDLSYVEAVRREHAQQTLVDALMAQPELERLIATPALDRLIAEWIARPEGKRLEPFDFAPADPIRETEPVR